MVFEQTEKVKELVSRVKSFIDTHVTPDETLYYEQLEASGEREVPEIMEDWKKKAKAAGLWNLFLPKITGGAQLTNLEYAPLAEAMGWSELASEAMNCSAPDTGNMEILAHFGTPEQKKQWLDPLLAGEIRSAFAMTEPGVASSDATNMKATAVLDGDEWVINGRKWYISGAGDPRCKILIFMGVTNPNNPRHQQHSQILVPKDTPGVKIIRAMQVFGYKHGPGGHPEVIFDNVRVPRENVLLGEGCGFEIAQARLGPGRIHHCMRTIGVAEHALQLLCERSLSRVAFKKQLSELGENYDVIAKSRIEINMARLLTLQAAHMMDTVGNKEARSEIAQIKVIVPNIALQVIDRAIQIHGAAGVSQDTELASMYAHVRILRIADGPDAVHRRTVAKLELAKYQ